MNSIIEESDSTINITEADHTDSHHIYQSKGESSKEKHPFILSDIDLDSPL